jgi:hypothetical protein
MTTRTVTLGKYDGPKTGEKVSIRLKTDDGPSGIITGIIEGKYNNYFVLSLGGTFNELSLEYSQVFDATVEVPTAREEFAALKPGDKFQLIHPSSDWGLRTRIKIDETYYARAKSVGGYDILDVSHLGPETTLIRITDAETDADKR